MNVSDIKVLEIGADVAVACCGLQFSLWGAEVKVSSPHAQDLMSLEPRVDGVSLLWTWVSANKSIVSHEIADLAREADVILSSLGANELAEAGVTPGEQTILHRIVPFAGGGVFEGVPGAALLYEAASGYLNINGKSEREPVRAPANMVSYIVGASAFGATLAALHKRFTTGEVDSVETSQLDVMTTIAPFVRSQYTEVPDTRHGGPGTGVRIWPIGDGYISANLFGKRTFSSALEHLGISEEEVPEHLNTPEKRYDIEATKQFLREKTPGVSAEALFNKVLAEGNPPIGLYLEPKEVLKNEHLQALNYFRAINHPDLGKLTYPGMPAWFSQIGPPSPAPARQEPDASWNGATLPGKKSKRRSGRPLEGTRIIDFTQAWVGPFASAILADLGAEVIKIESHKRVDVWRNWAGNIAPSNLHNENAHPFNTSGNFNSTNRNKREIAIDLNHKDGVSIARQLVSTADVVMDNYTPRVMRKFGLDYESLRQIKPDIICVEWAGYGNEGPYANYKANGTTIEAIAGWDALFGYPDEDPLVMGFYQCDAITGMQMAACTLLALIHRDLTGEGQSVSGSMIKSAIPYIGEEILNAGLGHEFVRRGNRHPDMVPHGVFPCKGQDCWVAIACRSAEDWLKLCKVVGIDAGTYGSPANRREHEDEIERSISTWTAARTREETVSMLMKAGLPAVPVLNALEILQHPEFTRREWFKKQFHPDMGEILHSGFPWQFSGSVLRAELPPPRLGEHSEEILRELGYEEADIATLFDQDTVACVLEKPSEDAGERAG